MRSEDILLKEIKRKPGISRQELIKITQLSDTAVNRGLKILEKDQCVTVIIVQENRSVYRVDGEPMTAKVWLNRYRVKK